MSYLAEREGVEKITMNEDTLAPRRRENTPRAVQEEDIKIMLVNGSLAPSMITTMREAITPSPTIVKMKLLPELRLFPPTPTTYLIHQMRESETASWLKAPRYHTPSIFI